MKARAYFEALGRRAASRGLNLRRAIAIAHLDRDFSPDFARASFIRGWWSQSSTRMRLDKLRGE